MKSNLHRAAENDQIIVIPVRTQSQSGLDNVIGRMSKRNLRTDTSVRRRRRVAVYRGLLSWQKFLTGLYFRFRTVTYSPLQFV